MQQVLIALVDASSTAHVVIGALLMLAHGLLPILAYFGVLMMASPAAYEEAKAMFAQEGHRPAAAAAIRRRVAAIRRKVVATRRKVVATRRRVAATRRKAEAIRRKMAVAGSSPRPCSRRRGRQEPARIAERLVRPPDPITATGSLRVTGTRSAS